MPEFYVFMFAYFAILFAPLFAKSWRVLGLIAFLAALTYAVMLVSLYAGGTEDGFDRLYEAVLHISMAMMAVVALARVVGLFLQGRGWSRFGVLWTDGLVVAFLAFWSFAGIAD